MTPADNLKGLHHIGIAVPSIAEALPRWLAMGLSLQSTDVVPTERVKVAVLIAGSTRIELLEPTSEDSPIAKFLAKKGPGVHHLAFHVGDCQLQIDTLTTAGAALLERFDALTGCPVLVNTSFNVRDEPIVCTPEDAYNCFLGTDIDVLAIGRCRIEKARAQAPQ